MSVQPTSEKVTFSQTPAANTGVARNALIANALAVSLIFDMVMSSLRVCRCDSILSKIIDNRIMPRAQIFID